jgi:hypothetical protein
VGENEELCGSTCVGRMSEEACRKDKGHIISYTAMTCADAGAIEWDGKYYCSFNSAVCCIKADPIDSTVTCNCFCDNESNCKDCEQQLANLRASDPDNKCRYYGGARPYTNAIGIKTCLDLDCACGSASSGVGGPL